MRKISRAAVVSRTFVETINGITPDEEGNVIIATGAATPSVSTYEYDPDSGRVAVVTETVDGDPRVTTMTYDGNGDIEQTVVTYRDKTTTSVYARTNGRITSITTTET